MDMAKEISVLKVRKDAEELFRGGFFCSEAVVSSTYRRRVEPLSVIYSI